MTEGQAADDRDRELGTPVRPTGPGPIGGDMSSIVWGLAHRMRLSSLTARHSSRNVMGAFALVNGLVSIGILSTVALLTGQPFIFPSLGPTAFMLFYTPTQPAASPRNTVFGHLIGCVAGYSALLVFGLLDAGPAVASEVTPARVGAAALSLGLTSGAMVWLRVPHPPAGATTLIISLGIMDSIEQMGVLMLAVVLMVLQGFCINRVAGVDYPVWAPRPVSARPTSG